MSKEGLTSSEDRELRQLTWFSLTGSLSEKSKARILELAAKDRRSEVRNPRPDPSSYEEDDPTGRLFDARDRISSITCPKCGSVVEER
jgi:hypothetical protein